MSKPKAQEPEPERQLLTANQIVAMNITLLRKRHGWTQDEFAAVLEPLLGERWSVAVVSAAERSVTGTRIREFTADELVAIARAFGVSIGALLTITADDIPYALKVADKANGLPWAEMVALATGAAMDEIDRRATQLAISTLQAATSLLSPTAAHETEVGRQTIAEARRTVAEHDANKEGTR